MAFTDTWLAVVLAPASDDDAGTYQGGDGGADAVRDARLAISERMNVLQPDAGIGSDWDEQGYKMGVACWNPAARTASDVGTIACSIDFITSQTTHLMYEYTAYVSNAAGSAAELYTFFNLDGASTAAMYQLVPSGRADTLCTRYVDSGIAANAHNLCAIVAVDSGSPAVAVLRNCLSVAPIGRNWP